MPAAIALLRAVNVGGRNKIKMDALRALHESLGLTHVQTFIQSGNVVFRAPTRDFARLPARISQTIEESFGFHADVVVRTAAEMRDVIRRNPFAGRPGIEPGKLVVTFLASEPGPEVREKALAVQTGPEELRFDGRELYIYYPNGQGRSKLTLPVLERALKVSGTGRNWNSVVRLFEMAEALEG